MSKKKDKQYKDILSITKIINEYSSDTLNPYESYMNSWENDSCIFKKEKEIAYGQ